MASKYAEELSVFKSLNQNNCIIKYLNTTILSCYQHTKLYYILLDLSNACNASNACIQISNNENNLSETN